MTLRLLLVLPVLGLFAWDRVTFDDHAVKYLALAAGALAALVAAWKAPRRTTAGATALAVFLGVRGAMLGESPFPDRAVRWWLLLAVLTALHFVAAAATRRNWRREAVPVLAWAGAVLGVWAVVQWLAGARQAHALFANRNFAGAGFAMLLPFALAWRGRLRWAPAALVAAGLAATGSRGGMLAAAVGLAFLFTWRRPRWRLAAFAAVPAVVVAAGLHFGDPNTVKVRLHWYEAAAKLGWEEPFTGHGADGFAREYPPIRPLDEHQISGGRRVHAVHNDYLESWAEGGLLGLLAHLWLLIAVARAVRGAPVAGASLLAFATASLVDLPLRDPSLLVLAFTALACGARRRRPARVSGVFRVGALVAALALLGFAWNHWRADRLFGRYTATRDAALLVEAQEGRHHRALVEGASNRALELEPHNGDILLRRAASVDDVRAILLEHDPHHVPARVQFATLVHEREGPLRAMSLLETTIDTFPHRYEPRLGKAALLRKEARLDDAEEALQEAEARADAPNVRAERLRLELARLDDDARLEIAMRRAPRAAKQAVEERVARAEAREREFPRPEVPRKPGESVADHVARIQTAKETWRAERDEATRPLFKEALATAAVYARVDPAPDSFRLAARAARGLGDVRRSGQYEGMAALLDALAAVRDGDEALARKHVLRARLAEPELAALPGVPEALRQFARDRPDARALLKRVLAPFPELLDALG